MTHADKRCRCRTQIRDLEARVEILSGTKEETYSHTRVIIQGLMEENGRLRNLVRELGGFMGDGLGGPLLDKTGWSMQQFRDFISRADSDTAYESFIKAKATAGSSSAGAGSSGQQDKDAEGGRKRKRDSVPPINDPYDLGNGGPPSSMRRNYSNQTGRSASGQRAQSPSELTSMLPLGDAFSRDTHDTAPSSFTSLVHTLNSSASAPFVDLGTGSRTRSGNTPSSYPQQTDFGLSYSGKSSHFRRLISLY